MVIMKLKKEITQVIKMNKESLIKAREIIIQSLSESNINNLDKLELMLNINNFLQENKYEENIKVLVKKNKQGGIIMNKKDKAIEYQKGLTKLYEET